MIASSPLRRRRGKWSEEEDEALIAGMAEASRLAESSGRFSFSEVAKKIPGRTAKQAQERWENVLRPGLKKGSWSDEEHNALLLEIIRYGQEWFSIKKRFPDRGFHSIKVKGRWLLGEVMPRQSPSGPPTAKSKTWSEEEVKVLKEQHQIHDFNLDLIMKHLLYMRPTAQVERKILKVCKSDTITKINDEICRLADDFRTGWSMYKAKQLYKKFQSTHPKKELQTSLDHSQTAHANECCRTPYSVCGSMSSSNGEEECIYFPEGVVKVSQDSRVHECSTSYVDQQEIQINGDILERKRKAEISDFFVDAESFAVKNKFTSLEMVQRSQVHEFLELIRTLVNELGFENIRSTFFNCLSSEQLAGFIDTCGRYTDYSFTTNPSLIYSLKLKSTPGYQDPRYNFNFIFPRQSKFIPNRPVGTMVFERGTLISLDGDDNARSLVGRVEDRHYFDLHASVVNAFYLFGQIYPTLVDQKETWSRQVYRDMNGKPQVILAHVEYKYFGNDHCRVRMQNISDCFPEILNLPPEI